MVGRPYTNLYCTEFTYYPVYLASFMPVNKINKVDFMIVLPTGVLWGTLSNSWTMFISNSSKDSRSWGKNRQC